MKTFIGTTEQRKRTVENVAENFAKKIADVVATHIKQVLENSLGHLAISDKRQDKARGENVSNKYRLPNADEKDAARPELKGLAAAYKLPAATED